MASSLNKTGLSKFSCILRPPSQNFSQSFLVGPRVEQNEVYMQGVIYLGNDWLHEAGLIGGF